MGAGCFVEDGADEGDGLCDVAFLFGAGREFAFDDEWAVVAVGEEGFEEGLEVGVALSEWGLVSVRFAGLGSDGILAVDDADEGVCFGEELGGVVAVVVEEV